MIKNKKGQVWIETVIYTLIGLSIIGIVLGIVKPAIDEKQDSLSIKQGIEALNNIDQRVNEVKNTGAGNVRELLVKIGKGSLVIDSENDTIYVSIERSRSEYSEPGQIVSVGGNIKAYTIKKGSLYNVMLILDYKNRVNVSYSGLENKKVYSQAAADYSLWIKNNGVIGSLTNIDFS